MVTDRIVIVGVPLAGKSTLARELRGAGYPTFCGDPRSAVRHPEPGVTYLPEGLAWGHDSAYVVRHWLPMPGPWVLEGQVMVRALRKHLRDHAVVPVDKVVLMANPIGYLTPGQQGMARGVLTVWQEIASRLAGITEAAAVDVGVAGVPTGAIASLVGEIEAEEWP